MVVTQSLPARPFRHFHPPMQGQSGQGQHGLHGSEDTPHVLRRAAQMMMTGVDLLHVPYRSSYVPDL